MEYFKRNLSEYTTTINPIANYMEQVVQFISVYKHVSKKEAVTIAKGLIKQAKPKDPTVTYRSRMENGDREFVTTPLSSYINGTVKSGDVIAPSFTVYDHPDKRKSLHSDFLKINIDKRKKHKALAFEAYQNNDMGAYVHNDVLQKVMKIFNNSLSGAYCSKSTTLYNPSQHYTLTSMTRSVASIGNAVTESIVAGNKGFYNPESVINYITSIVTVVNIKYVTAAMSMYKLYYPTVDEVIKVLKYTSDRYWEDENTYVVVKRYLNGLDKEQLAAIMYVNDLYHLKMYNESSIREFIGSMAAKVVHGTDNPLKALNRNVEGINNLVHHICMEDIRGKRINYSELAESDPELLMVLGSTADNIYRVLDKYKLLLKAFFITDILPIDIANIKDSYRDVIVLSDTDSTCGSYDTWTNWYFGNTRFTPEAVALSAVVMTINTQVIDHNIKVFSKNMNIQDSLVDLLKMKNEYFWSAFITANVSKHYYANTWIQEGNVFAKPKLELKGVHLIASSANQDIVAKAHTDMKKLLTTIEEGGKLNPREVLTKVADMERSILVAIDTGDTNIFKLDKIKDAAAYKLEDKSKTPYFHHELWTKVFAEKYGDPGDPTYMTVKVPTVLKSARTLNLYIETIEDDVIREKLRGILASNKKTALGTYRVPLSIAGGKGIPKEIIQAVDRHRVVLDNLNVYYLQLETVGLYKKKSMLFSEMGY